MNEEIKKTPDQPVATLENIAAVLKYLQAEGWKATKSTLHRHRKEGRLLPGPEGKFARAAVDKYALLHLKKAATGKRVSQAQDELQQRKLEQELKNLELKNRREQFAYEREQGLYIPRDQVEIELATRAGILVAGLKHWVQAKAADWIAAMSGDEKRVGELINILNRDLDEHINNYAASREYEVIIDADDDEARRMPGEVISNTEQPVEE